MKRSIRTQIAGIFIGVMAITIIGCILANHLFLDDYYRREKENSLEETYWYLNQGIESDVLDGERYQFGLEKLCENGNISIFVMDNTGEPVLYVTGVGEVANLQRALYNYIFQQELDVKKESLKEAENYIIRKSQTADTEVEYLEMVGVLGNQDPFIMRTPMESIQESAKISNQFFLIIGLIAILISSVLVGWFASRLTKPIRALSKISKRMAELDFTARYEEINDVPNEVDELGISMNKLSGTLEHTISELKTANNELQKDIQQKIQIDEMRKEFLSHVSHELKTPIALIQGYAEGLQECLHEDPASREFYCEVIMDEAAKMNNMVKNLLTLNQLESGNQLVNLERFDVVTLIQGVLSSVDILLKQKELKIIFKETEEIYVWADEFNIEQVLTNYLSNAIHHCEGEGVIEIKIASLSEVVRISVFNTGKPIPEEDLEKVWVKFYKVDRARTREYGGSGVGLSIVKAIMDTHHRECGVKNYENGVEFWFELDKKQGV